MDEITPHTLVLRTNYCLDYFMFLILLNKLRMLLKFYDQDFFREPNC